MPFENRSVTDDQTLGADIAHYRTGWLNFQPFFRLYISHYFALNQNRCRSDLPFNRSLLAYSNVGLSDDFSVHFAFNCRRRIEMQFAINFGAWSKVGANVRG